MEIERKWLLKKIPTKYKEVKHSWIEQFYVSIEPEVRLRKNLNSNVPYRITVKGNGTLSREEFESPISQEFYNKVKAFIGMPPIQKDYYVFNCEGYPLCVSTVDNGAFIYAEIEFESEEQARNYILPIDDAIEVTDNPEYKMKNYWIRSRTV